MTEEQVTGNRGQVTGKTPSTPHPAPNTQHLTPESPALNPQRGLRPRQLEFLAQVVPPALQSERDCGIPACVTIAQAILESAARVQVTGYRLQEEVAGDRVQVAGKAQHPVPNTQHPAPAFAWQWGASILFREAHNPFGIKWTHGAVDSRQSTVESGKTPNSQLRNPNPEDYTEFSAETHEVVHGKLEEQRALFRRFPDLESAFRAHAALLLNSPRYKPAMAALRDSGLGTRDSQTPNPESRVTNPVWQRFAVAIMNCGYSTDRPELCKQAGCPHYAGKLIKLVNDYRLNDARALAWYASGKDPGAQATALKF